MIAWLGCLREGIFFTSHALVVILFDHFAIYSFKEKPKSFGYNSTEAKIYSTNLLQTPPPSFVEQVVPNSLGIFILLKESERAH